MDETGQGFLKIENVRSVNSADPGSNLVYVMPGQSMSSQTCVQVPVQNVVTDDQGQSFIRLPMGQQLVNGQAVIQLPAGQDVSGGTTLIQIPSNQRLIQSPIAQPRPQLPANAATFTSAASEAGLMPNAQRKSLPVDYLLDNLIKNNEAILKKNDASAFKSRQRETLSIPPKPVTFVTASSSTVATANKTDYPLMKHFLNHNNAYPSTNVTTVPISVMKPTEEDVAKRKEIVKSQFITMKNVVARPRSPTRGCNLLKTDQSLFMNTFVERRVKKKEVWPLSMRVKDIICGLTAKAKVRLPGKGTLALDGNIYWCNFCPFTSESKADFISHVMIHRFSCKHCKYQAFSRAEVVRHSAVKHCHYDEDPWFYCSFFHDNLKLHCRNTSLLEESSEKLKEDHELMDMTIEMLPKDQDDLEDEDDDDEEEDEAVRTEVVTNHGQPKKSKGGNLQAQPVLTLVQNSTILKEKPEENQITSVFQNMAAQNDSSPDDWSNLSWICGYCDFVSQNYDLIKVHCSIMHSSEPVSATQTKVSPEMSTQIKQLDSIRQLHLDKGQKEFLLSTDSNNSTAPKLKPRVKQRAVMTTPVDPPVLKLLAEAGKSKVRMKRKKSPVKNISMKSMNIGTTTVRSYECFNCHGQTIKIEELCNHLNEAHRGEPFVGIDLRAVRLKQARFIVFCSTPGCSYNTRFGHQFEEHYKTCYPNWATCKEIPRDTHKSIVSTMKFATKNMRVKMRGKLRTKWFYCLGCDFKSNTIPLIKKHVLQQHKNRKPSYQYYHFGSKGKLKSTVYFCPRCKDRTFDTHSYPTLQKHLKSTHNVTNLKLMYSEDSQNGLEDTAEPTDDSSASMDSNIDDQDEKPTPEQLQIMMEAYLEGETTAKIASLGTSPRHAAVKAHLKLQNSGNLPHLHKCKICHYQCMGVNLMRIHIETDHPGKDLIAQDLKKKSQHQCSFVHLCPQKGCRFSARVYGDVQRHALSEHSIEAGELKEPSKPVLEIKQEPVDPQDDSGSYLCLFCKGQQVTFAIKTEMRDHIKSKHPGEEIVMRDLVARRDSKPCHLFMCRVESCSFSTPDQELSIEHLQMHGDITNLKGEALFERDETADDETMAIDEEEPPLPPDIQVHVNHYNDMESDDESV